jgi:DNA gyrase subunit B
MKAMGGYCDPSHYQTFANHWVEVEDNGRGIPVDLHPQKKFLL